MYTPRLTLGLIAQNQQVDAATDDRTGQHVEDWICSGHYCTQHGSRHDNILPALVRVPAPLPTARFMSRFAFVCDLRGFCVSACNILACVRVRVGLGQTGRGGLHSGTNSLEHFGVKDEDHGVHQAQPGESYCGFSGFWWDAAFPVYVCVPGLQRHAMS